ncbi:MAG: diacylglycerol kinase family protein [Tissierellia bacterium]|nr:diacylglycerol kinase family protein [Tissierellia bacterium]
MLLGKFEKSLLILSSKSFYFKNKYIINGLKKSFGGDVFNEYFIVKYTKNANSVKEYTREFIEKYRNSIIFMAGGDGSVHEVANIIHGTNVCLAVVPNGTGNDLARTIFGNKKPKKMFYYVNNLNEKPIDMIKINNKYSINATSFGFDGIVLEKALRIKNKFKLLRKFSFSLAIIFSINKINTSKYLYEYVLSNGEVIKGTDESLIVSLSNGKYFGGGLMPAPSAELDSGKIIINSIAPISPFSLMRMKKLYKKGEHLDLDISKTYEVISGNIKPIDQEYLYGNIDGELEKFREINFEIVRNEIKLAFYNNDSF